MNEKEGTNNQPSSGRLGFPRFKTISARCCEVIFSRCSCNHIYKYNIQADKLLRIIRDLCMYLSLKTTEN